MKHRQITPWLVACSVLALAWAVPANTAESKQRLEARLGVTVDVTRDTRTPFARRIIMRGSGDLRGARPNAGFIREPSAMGFLRRHGAAAFGIDEADSQLREAANRVDALGLRTQTLQQMHRGVPVFGARLRANFNRSGELRSINGGFVPGLKLTTTPTVRAVDARRNAVAHVAARLFSVRQADLVTQAPTLYVFQKGRTQGVAGPVHLVYEVEVRSRQPLMAARVREMIYVDAHSGDVVEQITGNHDVLDRRIYDGGFTSPFLVWSEGDATPFGVPAIDDLIAYTEDTYNLFATLSDGAWLGWTGASPVMQAVNNSPSVPCPNARWNGSFIEFCPGTTSDDVVAHEWAHAYTQATHGLIYQWQSGALNESYSDIFGEIVDFLNADGTDMPGAVRNDGACSAFAGGPAPRQFSYRWLTGEDATAFGGAIRDLWRPTCLGDPGKVSDSQYFCGTGDSGGVHSNSGVPNHGFALLVDGGTYNGVTVQGIGLTRAAHIYWRAMTAYQVPDSTFADHADALEASCNDLAGLGLNLPALSTQTAAPAPSGQIVAAEHCAAVAAMAAAVELRTPPSQCNFEPMFQQDPPPVCAPGEAPQEWLSNDFEDGLGAWTSDARAVANPATFDTPDWTTVESLPFDREGSAAFVPDLIIGDCAADTEAGVVYLQSPVTVVPAIAEDSLLVFDHSLATEALWDGGNVKISVNGGPYVVVPPGAFRFNGYNATLNASDNPLQREPAFTGSDGGNLKTEWGQSQIELAGLASPGDSVQIRFELGVDGCNGLDGWYVDDVRAVYCAVAPDSDGDGVSDAADNCTLVANPDQRDSNGDGIGNVCDADLNGDCAVNFLDLGEMKSVFFTPDADADLDGDGAVNFQDLASLKALFFAPPGPSASGCE
ncbi:MAG: M4 family metallopeptidase [Pseudomonadota bacterium]